MFAWLATIWTGRPVFTTPSCSSPASSCCSSIGGVSGFMTRPCRSTGSSPTPTSSSRTCTTCCSGINVFPVIGGIYYWFPKFTGRMMGERLGKLGFWMLFIGFNVAFFPMHIVRAAGHAAADLHLSGRAWAGTRRT